MGITSPSTVGDVTTPGQWLAQITAGAGGGDDGGDNGGTTGQEENGEKDGGRMGRKVAALEAEVMTSEQGALLLQYIGGSSFRDVQHRLSQPVHRGLFSLSGKASFICVWVCTFFSCLHMGGKGDKHEAL